MNHEMVEAINKNWEDLVLITKGVDVNDVLQKLGSKANNGNQVFHLSSVIESVKVKISV